MHLGPNLVTYCIVAKEQPSDIRLEWLFVSSQPAYSFFKYSSERKTLKAAAAYLCQKKALLPGQGAYESVNASGLYKWQQSHDESLLFSDHAIFPRTAAAAASKAYAEPKQVELEGNESRQEGLSTQIHCSTSASLAASNARGIRLQFMQGYFERPSLTCSRTRQGGQRSHHTIFEDNEITTNRDSWPEEHRCKPCLKSGTVASTNHAEKLSRKMLLLNNTHCIASV